MWNHIQIWGRNMGSRRFVSLMSGISVFAVSAMMASSAAAQDAANTRAVEIDEIVVTGEKIERRLQDTASSVTAISGEELAENVGAQSVSEAIRDVPNVVYNGTIGAPIIRGQDTQGPNFGSTAFFAGTIPRATINLDGHYQNFYEYAFGGTSIWDVDMIEVFRGPQTTSQGANAIAGAIIVNTKDPTFTPEAAYQAEYGSYNRYRTSVMASGPIAGNQLAGRIALDYTGRDTFIDYVNPSFAKGDADLNFSTFNVRGKLLWEPTHIAGLAAKLTYAHTFNNRPTWEAASKPYAELASTTTTMPSWSQDTDTGVLDVKYDFGNGLTLFNQSQASKTHVHRVTWPVTNGSATIDQRNLSNETRVTFGERTSTWSGVVGLYVANTTSDDTLYLRGLSNYDDDKTNLGVFSEVSYRLTERWTLTGGLRFQMDQFTRVGNSDFFDLVPLDYDETFSAILPKISLAYAVTPDVTVGALVNRGYNPGGVNLSFATKEYITFEEESVWNYELFTRARLLDGRLVLNGNLFFSDYDNSQRLLPDYLFGVQYGSIVVNAESAESYGLELSAELLARHDLKLRAGLGLLRSKIGSFVNATGTSFDGNEYGARRASW